MQRPQKVFLVYSRYQTGDALTTIAAAASSGSEVFLTDMLKGRLTYRQIGFSGTRHSDHIAALAAFQVSPRYLQSNTRIECLKEERTFKERIVGLKRSLQLCLTYGPLASKCQTYLSLIFSYSHSIKLKGFSLLFPSFSELGTRLIFLEPCY